MSSGMKAGGFSPLPAEADDKPVVCAECGTVAPASDMTTAYDRIESVELDDGREAVVETSRQYVCSEDCTMDAMFAEEIAEDIRDLNSAQEGDA